jgi:hypothetical protein
VLDENGKQHIITSFWMHPKIAFKPLRVKRVMIIAVRLFRRKLYHNFSGQSQAKTAVGEARKSNGKI